MKTLLLLSDTADLAEAIRQGLKPEAYRVVQRATYEEAEPLVAHGLAAACILDVERANVQALWTVQKLRRHAPDCPLILFAGAKPWEWEEEAYLEGVHQVILRPFRPRLFTAMLERLWEQPSARPASLAVSARPSPPTVPAAGTLPSAPAVPVRAMEVLRDFSGILTHSLNAEAMLRQFLLLLRNLLGINRGVIFLRVPLSMAGAAAGVPKDGGLRAASSVGISSGLLQHFELSFETGIGGHLFRTARILRRSSEETANDLEAQKEFELLGSQVAVPILDRENVLGAAVFDGKITGELLTNEELQLVFHLLEQLGLAVRNIWLHDQVSGNHQLMVDIMRELGSACVVVGQDLSILHANRMARRYFGGPATKNRDLEFCDLPPVLGGKVYQVLKTGAASPGFRFEPESLPGTIYSVSIVPFQRHQEGLPASALLMAEDLTQSEQIKRLEIESANLRLVKQMSVRLVNEIGNALVPMGLHQQMLEEKLKKKSVDLEFLKLMNHDVGESVRRVTRLASQMRFLARDELLSDEPFPLLPLLEEAFQDARRHQAAKTAEFKCETVEPGLLVKGDRGALKHALGEILLNALQANPVEPKVGVRVKPEPGGNGHSRLCIEVLDNGPGFTAEAIEKASNPFFSTRVVGVGLGLAVSRKIVETHQGRLEIVPAHSGCVRISLPLARS